jgi:hypothetical protein
LTIEEAVRIGTYVKNVYEQSPLHADGILLTVTLKFGLDE